MPASDYRAPAVLALPLFSGILVAASACVFGFGGIQFLGALTATVCAAVWAWDAWLSPDCGGRS
ncbi:hypothetical protein FM119_08640 [Mycetocola reblochoni REB411]|uniref:Uncharacterized protein n=2 Tax=Mycetocola reblochoni TaxID=331618 RepID=A0A1R4JQ26_9MICO|nr:hypothetical protein FM119_08640 [Mycetocola reblochoni REB411]